MKPLLTLIPLALLAPFASAQTIVLAADDFNDGMFDTTQWSAISASPGSSVAEAGGVLEFTSKCYLRSNDEHEPNGLGGVRVRGRWKFVAASPDAGVLEVDTRTDAVPSGPFFEAANALAFNLWLGPSYPGVATIQPRGVNVQVGPVSIMGSLHWTNDAWYEFEALDGGNQATWTIRESGDPTNVIVATCAILSGAAPMNHVVIHGREHIGGPNVCDLDDFVIDARDCNGNQVPDGVDIAGGAVDCDGDLTLDVCQIASTPYLDLNTNGVLDSCECVATNYCVGAANSIGPGARMGYGGTLSIGLDDLTLICTGLPPNTPGVFFYGPAQTAVPFGNGTRCVAGGITRLPVSVAGLSGIASRSIHYANLPAGGQVAAGSTRHFQFWYRDSAAGGALFNLSDGLSIRFCQ